MTTLRALAAVCLGVLAFTAPFAAQQPSLDFGGRRFADAQGAAAFGRVVRGMDVAQRIQQQPAHKQALTPPVPITKAFRVVAH